MKTGYSFSGLDKMVIHCAGLRCFKQVVVGLAVALVAFTGLSQPMPTDFFDFNYTDGSGPIGAPVISGNVMYGVTSTGDLNACADEPDTEMGTGTIFRINTDGTGFANLHVFSADPTGYNADGTLPSEGLVLDGDTLYGTTQKGGAYGTGTIFKINTDGTAFTVLHTFDHSDGVPYSFGSLVVTNGIIYGLANGGEYYAGNIFKINTDGSGYANLHDFDYSEGSDDGGFPQTDSLTISGNTLFGATPVGGAGSGNGGGIIFSLNTDGSDYQVLYSFPAVDPDDSSTFVNVTGSSPFFGVTVSGDTLYGITSEGGAYGQGTLFSMKTDGTGFTTLVNFTNLGADGNLIVTCSSIYGSSSQLFSVNLDGTGFEFLTTNPAPDFGGTYFSAGITLSGNTLFGSGYTNMVDYGCLLATPADIYAVSQPQIFDLACANQDFGNVYTITFGWNPFQVVSGVPAGAMLELQDGGFPDYVYDDVFIPVTADMLKTHGRLDVTFPECFPDPMDQNVQIRIRYVNCGISGPWSDLFSIGN